MPQIDINKLSGQLGDLRTKVAALSGQVQTLVSEDTGLVCESNEIQVSAETQPRVDQIAARRKEIETAYAGLNAKLAAENARLTEVQNAHDRAQVCNIRELALERAPSASPLANTQTGGERARVEVLPPTKDQLISDIGGMFRILAAAKLDREHAIKIAGDWGYDRVRTAMDTASFAGGGFLIPETYRPQMIDLLYPRVVIRAMGVLTWPLVNGNLTVPKLTGSATANYIGEENTPSSQPTGGNVSWRARKLSCFVPISNSLLRFATPQADQVARNNMTRAVGIKEDRTFIRGVGTENSPKGMRYLAPAANVIAATANASAMATFISNITSDCSKLEGQLLSANVPMFQAGWIFDPLTATYLAGLRTSLSQYAFPEMNESAEPLPGAPGKPAGMFRRRPYWVTTSIPSTLGSGSDESEVYLVDASELVIAEDPNIVVRASQDASYTDENGNMVSAFQADQTVLQIIKEHDFNTQHPEAIGVLTGVRWRKATLTS